MRALNTLHWRDFSTCDGSEEEELVPARRKFTEGEAGEDPPAGPLVVRLMSSLGGGMGVKPCIILEVGTTPTSGVSAR